MTNHITNSFQTDGGFTFNGQLSGNGLADFMFGRSSSFTQGGGEFKDLKGVRWSFFVQDNWRVSKRLALNLGVRWDPYWPPYDRAGTCRLFPAARRPALAALSQRTCRYALWRRPELSHGRS